jgi:hypothetical protein
MPDKPTLSARALKATLVVDAAAVAGIQVPNGVPKFAVQIQLPDRIVTTELNAKSLRRAVTAIATAGEPESVAVVLSGKLEAGNVLTEAAIVAQPRAPAKAAAA